MMLAGRQEEHIDFRLLIIVDFHTLKRVKKYLSKLELCDIVGIELKTGVFYANNIIDRRTNLGQRFP